MFKVRIVGADSVKRSFAEMERRVNSMSFDEGLESIYRAARRFVPVLTGRLRGSIRMIKRQKGGIIEAGAGIPNYAQVQERGRYNNIRPKYYMRRASQTNIKAAVERDVQKIINQSF